MFYAAFFGVFGMVTPFLNVYFREGLGFSGRQIGLLSMFSPLMSLIVAIPLASIADRYRCRIPMLITAIIGYATLMTFARLPRTFAVWAAVWLMATMFSSLTSPMADSLIARMSFRHGLNYGSMRMWGSATFAISAVICGGLWERFGLHAMFLSAGIIFFPTALFAFGLEEDRSAVVKSAPKMPLRAVLRDKPLLYLLAITFFVGAATTTSVAYDGIYMNALGGSGLFIGLLFSLSAFSELPLMHFRGQIVRKLNTPNTLLLACAFFCIAFAGYAVAWRPWMLLLTTIVKGMGYGLFLASAVQFISERVPEHVASTVQSIFTATMSGLAPLTAAPIAGELYDRFGVKAVFFFITFSAATATLLLLTTIANGVFRLPNAQENPARGVAVSLS